MLAKSNEPNAKEHVRRPRDAGFALLIVLWMAALLALAAAALAASAKFHFQATRNSIESQRAHDLADVGVRLALRGLATTPDAVLTSADSVGRTCRLPEGEVLTSKILDEAGKIDLNTADDDLLRALLTGTGVSAPAAASIIAAITDYRDDDNERSLNGAEETEYRASGRRSGPKNAPFDSAIEIGAVLGVSSEMFARIAPHLTVHSGQNGVDPAHATLDLLDILARAQSSGNTPDLGGTLLARDRLIPTRFVAASARLAFSVYAQATTVAGTQAARTAVITKLQGARPNVANSDSLPGSPSTRRDRSFGTSDDARPLVSWRIWQWDRAPLLSSPVQLQASEALPPC